MGYSYPTTNWRGVSHDAVHLFPSSEEGPGGWNFERTNSECRLKDVRDFFVSGQEGINCNIKTIGYNIFRNLVFYVLSAE